MANQFTRRVCARIHRETVSVRVLDLGWLTPAPTQTPTSTPTRTREVLGDRPLIVRGLCRVVWLRVSYSRSLFSGIVTRCANRVSRWNDLAPADLDRVLCFSTPVLVFFDLVATTATNIRRNSLLGWSTVVNALNKSVGSRSHSHASFGTSDYNSPGSLDDS